MQVAQLGQNILEALLSLLQILVARELELPAPLNVSTGMVNGSLKIAEPLTFQQQPGNYTDKEETKD